MPQGGSWIRPLQIKVGFNRAALENHPQRILTFSIFERGPFMLHFRCSMNWKQLKPQQLSQPLCQICRFVMQLIFMYSFPCHQQSEPPALPGTFTFYIFTCSICFRWFKTALWKIPAPAIIQTHSANKWGPQNSLQGFPEWHQPPVFPCQTHPWAAGSAWAGQRAAPALESFGNKPGNQSKPRLAAPLEAGS